MPGTNGADRAGDPALRLGGRWRLWDQFSLRGAGFPADGVLRLVDDELALAADRIGLPPGSPRSAGAAPAASAAEWKAFEESFAASAVKSALTLQSAAATPEFRTAVAWQNRVVLGRAVQPYLSWRPTAARTSQVRQREELVAHYWQRLCVKNDTIGFFGPVGWGRYDPTVPGLAVDPGRGLVAETTVYFASWAIDGLARSIGADPVLAGWVAPRRVPFVRVDGRTVSLPGRPAQQLTPELSEVLDRCDGTRPALRIGQELGHDVTEALTELVRRRLVVWRLDIPADAYPERHLRAWLATVEDPAARQRGLDKLAVLEHHRERVREATRPGELSAAMAALEDDFVALTETAATREKGATTAPGRALVYSDCRRAASVRVGPEVLSALAPLDPLLTSATWLTSALAERVMARARRVFDRLAGPVDLATFWFACMPILHGEAVSDVTELQAEFWARWVRLLRIDDGARRVVLSLADLADRVREVFDAPGGGWPTARYLSPDVMIAATDAEAVGRGEFELVLGELHVAINTLGASLYLNQHPNPAELVELTDRDYPEPRLMPLISKENRSRLSTRIRYSLARPEDYYVALVDFTADPHRPRTVNSADVSVRAHGERLVAVLPDGAEFDVVDVFSHVLTSLVLDRWRILPERDHTPRVTVDKLVLARETWRFAADQLAFAEEKTEARRFVRARRWATTHQLPRYVFVTSPAEPRPLFVDFDSPVYVNLLAKAARRLVRKDPGARLTVTEMLPTPEQTWLTDDRGDRYTSELRFVAFDTGRDEPES
ncbi:lantibiotic dehydratase [Micromonospora eburnea]|uniref:Lantibiotic dehydratase, C terminus n=1 Tax=Micromonospora eburnea TaxID=227316 RepID=A0A1C6UVE3_9ACTN|nr:lantibiotic dehydratase [Micromonospora eburnea]SCL57833.1 Lantibiotic dehydratase, C terminus [Micromonospora eburnea]